MIDIESKANAKFKKWQSLLSAKGIKTENQALISGEKLVGEFLKQNPEKSRELLFPPKGKPIEGPSHLKNYRLKSELFNELDVIGTHAPLLVVDVPPISTYEAAPPQGLELVVALSDPGNLGAVLRSAEAFGVSRVILTKEAASPYLPKVVRGSSGACFRLALARAKELAEFEGSPCFALDMTGEELTSFTAPKNFFLILGEEGRGVPAILNAGRLSIEMKNSTESLNAVVAASIALYVLKHSLGAPK